MLPSPALLMVLSMADADIGSGAVAFDLAAVGSSDAADKDFGY